jgi:hypothetical protein
MRTVLSRSMMVFALLVSFSVFGYDKPPDCRSWWSKLDGVHHCLLSGNVEDTILPQEAGRVEIFPTESSRDDISTPNNSQEEPPPGLQVTDIPENNY